MSSQVASRTRGKTLKRDDALSIILFLLPAGLFLGIYILWPILSSFEMSFFRWNGVSATRVPVGLGNWSELVRDPVFWASLRNNVVVLVLSIAIQVPIGLALAVLVAHGGRIMVVLKTIYFLPMMMSSIAIGVLFKYIYDPVFGVVTPLLRLLGLGALVKSWLGDPQIALYSVIAVICWQFIPFYMILFLAGIAGIPEELHEAAILDGATENQYFWRITLPLLRGTLRAGISLSILGSLTYFDLVWVMTQGGPARATELMATYMVKNAFLTFEMGYASTIASAMFIVVMVAAAVVFFVIRGREE